MVDSEPLKTEMAKENVNQEYSAYKLKVAQSTLSLKTDNDRSFIIEKMFGLAEILNTDPRDLR